MVYHSTQCQKQKFLKILLLISEKPCVKLPKPPNNLGMQSVNNYYKKCNLKERLLFWKN